MRGSFERYLREQGWRGPVMYTDTDKYFDYRNQQGKHITFKRFAGFDLPIDPQIGMRVIEGGDLLQFKTISEAEIMYLIGILPNPIILEIMYTTGKTIVVRNNTFYFTENLFADLRPELLLEDYLKGI